MTVRRHFDRLAQPRLGEPLVLSPAAPYSAVTAEPLAPISVDHPETPAAPPPQVAAPTPAVMPLSLAPQHVARKLAPTAPSVAAAPAMLSATPRARTVPPIARTASPQGEAPASIGQPGRTVPLSRAESLIPPAAVKAAGAPELAGTAVAPAIAGAYPPAVDARIADLPEVSSAVSRGPAAATSDQPKSPGSPAPSRIEPAPLRLDAVQARDTTPPRLPGAGFAPRSAAPKPAPDLGLAQVSAWLDAGKTHAPAAAPAATAPAPAAGGVHIGVVEVRVSPPQPAPQVQHRAPVAPLATQPALARGYGWRFGLGQS